MPELKEIEYRGGLLRFRIPSDWMEEYGQESGGTFYAQKADSGTLRLSVLTFRGQAMAEPADLVDALEKWGEPELLPSGNAIVNYRETAEQDERELSISYWQLANAVAPRHIRVAVFSYTILANQLLEPGMREELQLLDDEIRTAVFSAELGVLPA